LEEPKSSTSVDRCWKTALQLGEIEDFQGDVLWKRRGRKNGTGQLVTKERRLSKKNKLLKTSNSQG